MFYNDFKMIEICFCFLFRHFFISNCEIYIYIFNENSLMFSLGWNDSFPAGLLASVFNIPQETFSSHPSTTFWVFVEHDCAPVVSCV